MKSVLNYAKQFQFMWQIEILERVCIRPMCVETKYLSMHTHLIQLLRTSITWALKQCRVNLNVDKQAPWLAICQDCIRLTVWHWSLTNTIFGFSSYALMDVGICLAKARGRNFTLCEIHLDLSGLYSTFVLIRNRIRIGKFSVLKYFRMTCWYPNIKNTNIFDSDLRYTLHCSTFGIRCYTMSIRMISIYSIWGLPLQKLDFACYGNNECMRAFAAPL